jgi:hypothetical protein
VEAEIDHTIYPAGQKVSDEQMAQINLTMESFPHSRAIAAASIGHDLQALCLGIKRRSHRFPITPDSS